MNEARTLSVILEGLWTHPKTQQLLRQFIIDIYCYGEVLDITRIKMDEWVYEHLHE